MRSRKLLIYMQYALSALGGCCCCCGCYGFFSDFSIHRVTFTLWLQCLLILYNVHRSKFILYFIFISRIIDDLSIPLIFGWFERDGFIAKIFEERFLISLQWNQMRMQNEKEKKNSIKISTALTVQCSNEKCTTRSKESSARAVNNNNR